MKTATSNFIKIAVSILIGGGFLWLALRNLDFQEVGAMWSNIQTGWIAPFVFLAIAGFWFRMERWKLLTEHDRLPSHRRILFAGVMNGYAVNYAVPRLGEITRCYYVAKKEDKPVAAILGTVVLERIIDMFVVLAMMVAVLVFVVTDTRVVMNLLGLDATEELGSLYLKLALIAFGGLLLLVLGWWLLGFLASKFERVYAFRTKLLTFWRHFMDGLLSVRSIRHPVRFLFLTVGLWGCYIAMAGIPFSMLPGSGMEQLGAIEALVITMIASVGVIIPSPGGIGTYHLFVQKSLLLLYGIPEAAGFTYAFASHALVFLVVMVTTPVALLYAKQSKRP